MEELESGVRVGVQGEWVRKNLDCASRWERASVISLLTSAARRSPPRVLCASCAGGVGPRWPLFHAAHRAPPQAQAHHGLLRLHREQAPSTRARTPHT
eukprot:2465013-Pleurochrysis_carterae.AAC.2